MGLRQAFVSKWNMLHEERCRIVAQLGACLGLCAYTSLGVVGSERPAARAIVHTHDLLARLRRNLCEDHVAGRLWGCITYTEERYMTPCLPTVLTLMEKVFTYYWMQQPIAAAGLFVSCDHNVPDDFALCTAVGVLHGKLTPDGKHAVF